MKMAFIGDSYCEYVTNGSWLFLVAKEYDADIIANGVGGRHLFHAYEVLLDVVDEADYIILCISEPYRMPNNHGIHITPENSSTDIAHLKGKLKTFHKLYYNDFISIKWHEVSQKGLLMQIDELMLQKKKKCIWLPCFNESMQGFIPKSGPIGNEALCTIIFKIESNDGVPSSRLPVYRRVLYGRGWVRDREPDTRKNHMNVRNNRNIARLITDIIGSNDFKPREINMKDYFEGLE